MPKYFTVDARTILHLGRDSIKDNATALLELVKNSYDAEATTVEIEVRTAETASEHYLRIADDGVGMSEESVDNNWLRIGYSHKTVNTHAGRRRKTGEKGIGRLSADRLGSLLELRTKAAGESAVGLRVEWSSFNVTGKELRGIPIEELAKPEPRLPAASKSGRNSGTELIIRELREVWTASQLNELRQELSVLQPPFRRATDFSIVLDTDIPGDHNGLVETEPLAVPEIDLELTFDGDESCTFIVHGRQRGKKQKLQGKRKIPLAQVLHRDIKDEDELAPLTCGPVQVRLMFFPRKPELVRGTRFSLSDLKDFLDRHAGVRIYRDGIRVRPYGLDSSEGDWLGLGTRKTRDPAGAGRETFSVAPNQLVGAVFVSRDGNPTLTDSAAREGLIHGPAFDDLRRLVLGCIALLEVQYHTVFAKRRAEAKAGRKPRETVAALQTELTSLARELRHVRSAVEATDRSVARPVEKSLDQINSVLAEIRQSSESLEELASQATTFRTLATVGIAAAVFGHETQSSLAECSSAIRLATRLLRKDPSRVAEPLDELRKAEKYAEAVAGWGKFALMRVSRDKRRRRKLDVSAIVSAVIDQMIPALGAVGIDVARDLGSVIGRTFAMDVEAVLINLLTNAYNACMQVRRKRQIRVLVQEVLVDGRRGAGIAVGDSGPGVDKQYTDKIWEPLFTTKVDKAGRAEGTGLGLTIVDAVVRDLGGRRKVDKDEQLGGALFSIWLPLT